MPRDRSLKVWIILGSILFVLVLIGSVPVGVDAAYDQKGIVLAARIGFFSIRLGGDRKTKRRKKDEAQTEKSSKPEKKKELPPLPLLRVLALNGYNTLCRLLARVQTDYLKIYFTSAFSDPALTALTYGAAGTAMEGLLTAGGRRIHCSDLQASVDFDSEEPVLDARICLTLRIGRLLVEAIRFGFGFLRDFLRYKKEDT